MADYKDIVGTTVRNNAGALTGAKTGELFYDSTALDFIYRHPNVTSAGSFRTITPVNTGRSQGGSSGTTTSALYTGGVPNRAISESWNGSAWTEVGDLNTARQGVFGSGASNTQAIVSGGETPGANSALAESWNGSSWTEVADLNAARRLGCGGGPYTAAIASGGYTSTNVGNTETWNGSAWTEVADMNTGRRNMMGNSGTTTSQIVAGGKTSGVLANSESLSDSSG